MTMNIVRRYWHGWMITGLGLGLGLTSAACSDPDAQDDGNQLTGIASIGGTDSVGGSTTTSEDVNESTGEVQLLYLEVSPPETLLEVDLATAATQAYTVNAIYSDGNVMDVTADATWEVDNPEVGTMSGSTLEIPPFTDSAFNTAILSAKVGERTGRAQITVAAYRFDRDFFFVLPFEDEEGPQSKELTFNTGVKSLDVFINMDTTSSMEGALENLQNSLASTIIPGIQALVPDTQFGGGTFQDFPIQPYGFADIDQPFQLFQEITANTDDVQSAVLSFTLGNGADGPESNIEALYQIATGEGLAGPGPTEVLPNDSGIGGVGFREGALPMVVSITNAVSHDSVNSECGQLYGGTVQTVAHSREQAMEALGEICARVVQIALVPGQCSSLSDGIIFAEATGSVIPPEAWDLAGHPQGCAPGQCCTGLDGAGVDTNDAGMCPMAFRANYFGGGVDTSFSSALQLLAAYGQFSVTRKWFGVDTDIAGEPLPAGFTTADFIKVVRPFDHGPVPLPGVPAPTLSETTFENVIPDTDAIFTVEAFNDLVPQGERARMFTATIEVLADDCGDLDEREVLVLVPPNPLPPPEG